MIAGHNSFRRLANCKDFDPYHTTRHNQLDSVNESLRQIIANLRAAARTHLRGGRHA